MLWRAAMLTTFLSHQPQSHPQLNQSLVCPPYPDDAVAMLVGVALFPLLFHEVVMTGTIMTPCFDASHLLSRLQL